MQGCCANTCKVRDGVVIEVTYAVHFAVAKEGNNLLTPCAVIQEKCNFAAFQYEAAVVCVGADGAAKKGNLYVGLGSAVETISGRNDAAKLITSTQLVDHSKQLILQVLACDALHAVSLYNGCNGGFEVLVFCHIL